MGRYLTVRVLYPKPGHLKDIVDAISEVADAARQFGGLVEIGAWLDRENDCIVSMSLWESAEQASEATRAMHPRFKDIPWAEWERKPAENHVRLERLI